MDSSVWRLRCRDKGKGGGCRRGFAASQDVSGRISLLSSRLSSKQGAVLCLESRGSLGGLFFLSTEYRSTKKHGSGPCQELHFRQDFRDYLVSPFPGNLFPRALCWFFLPSLWVCGEEAREHRGPRAEARGCSHPAALVHRARCWALFLS